MQDVHEDCRFWRLTPYQCCQHHVRLTRMYAAQTRTAADETERQALKIYADYRRRLRTPLGIAIFALVLAIFDILS